MMTSMSEQRTAQPVDLAEAARILGEVVGAVDRAELESPRWLRDRIKAAAVTASALVGEDGTGQATLPMPAR